MKIVLLNRPKEGQTQVDQLRFRQMLTSLRLGGVSGKYYTVQTKSELLSILESEKPDLVYCANYYVEDEQQRLVSIHRILENNSTPYIGSAPEKLELVLSKFDLKVKWQKDKIPTPRFFKVSKAESGIAGLNEAINAADYPYILKPDREGNSRGLDQDSIVFDRRALASKAIKMLGKYNAVLVEKFLGNAKNLHEYTVAMIGNGNQKLLMPAEIKLKQAKPIRIVTTQDKENHLTQAIAVKDPILRKRLAEFAGKAFESAGVRDYSRCDLMMADDQLYAIEINGLPMVPDKWFEVCAYGVPLNADQYINAIIMAGLGRVNKNSQRNMQVPSQMAHMLPASVMTRLLDA